MAAAAAGCSPTIADLPSQTGADDTWESRTLSSALHARNCKHAAKAGTGAGMLLQVVQAETLRGMQSLWPNLRVWCVTMMGLAPGSNANTGRSRSDGTL